MRDIATGMKAVARLDRLMKDLMLILHLKMGSEGAA